MAPISLTLFGGFRAIGSSGDSIVLPAKTNALVAFLALPPGRFHLRDKLATLLWSDAGDSHARDSLRQGLRGIRRAWTAEGLPDLMVDGHAYAIDASSVDVDAVRFEGLATERALESWRAAAAIYRGELLDGMTVSAPPFDEWLLAERERFRALAIDVLTRLLAHDMTPPATPDALEGAARTARQLLAIDPLQEPVHRALMRLYVYRDRRGSAIRHYQQCVATLRHELGTEPEPETKRLYEAILQRRVSDAPLPRRVRPVPRDESTVHPQAALVGREAERAVLRMMATEASRGAGQVLTLTGEAGIGKSALLRALSGEIDATTSRIMPGRAYETTQTLPFGPWIDAFRSGGVTPDDEAVAGFDRVWRAEISRLLPELSEAALPPGSPDGSSLFEGVAQLVRSFAQRELVVITLEDIHWADDMSLRLLAFVARRLPPWQAILAVTARTEHLGSSPLLASVLQELRGEPHVKALRLVPLSTAQTRELVDSRRQPGRTSEAHTWLSDRVWSLSRGNPYVAVEALRAIEEAVGLVEHATDVNEVVRRRLLSVSEAAQVVIEVAATIGHEFEFALARDAGGQTEDVTAAAIEELVRRGLLEGTGESFTFSHERIRDVAYEMLSSDRRRVLHGVVAHSIEALYPDQGDRYSAELGDRYAHAEQWAAAASWHRRAAAVMAVRFAHREALAALERALALLARVEDRESVVGQEVDLWLDLRNMHITWGDFERAFHCLQKAATLTEQAGDDRRLARILSFMTHHVWATDGYPAARDCAERAFALAQPIDDPGLFAECAFFLGSTCVCGGDYDRAVQVLSSGIDRLSGPLAYERFALPYMPSCSLLSWLAWALVDLGRDDEAFAMVRRIEDIATLTADRFSAAVAKLTSGLVLVRSGRAAEGVPILGAAVSACTEGGIYLLLPYAAAHLGLALARAGQPQEGAAMLRQVIAEATARKFVANLAQWTSMLGEAVLLAGDTETAAATAAEALALAKRYRERGNEAFAERLAGAVANARSVKEII